MIAAQVPITLISLIGGGSSLAFSSPFNTQLMPNIGFQISITLLSTLTGVLMMGALIYGVGQGKVLGHIGVIDSYSRSLQRIWPF